MQVEKLDEKIKQEEVEFGHTLFDLLEVEQSEKEVIQEYIFQYGIPQLIELYNTLPIHEETKQKLHFLVNILNYVDQEV